MKKYILSLILLSTSCISFAENDGTCSLVQNPDGTFRIVCEGDGVIYDYETITNRVTYRIANCEDLRTDLSSLYSELDTFQKDLNSELSLIRQSCDSLGDSINAIDPFVTGFDNVQTDYITLDHQIGVLQDTFNYNQVNLQSLSNTIDSIACCSDSITNLTPQCCHTDLSPIIERLNQIIQYDIYITNRFDYIANKFGGFTSYYSSIYAAGQSRGNITFAKDYKLTYLPNYSSVNSKYYNLANINSQILKNNTIAFSSLNNYFYKFLFDDFAFANTNLNTLTLETTNFFSFFRGEIGVNGVLEDWSLSDGSYYDYLTNHYLTTLFNPSRLSQSESEKTNWFARIETLLAALVFADAEGTNTVDESEFTEQKDELEYSLNNISSLPTTQLNVFENTSRSIVDSVRIFSTAFSSASLPSRVNLVRLGSSVSSSRLLSSSSGSDVIYFDISEISPLLEACHCLTTLIWCFSGIIFIFWFIHYTVKTSYNLVVFAWSVVSAVFGK